MAITSVQVKELRDRTGLPMMKCKEALVACDGDLEAAVDHLRKQGLAAADKRSHRDTNSGSLGVACAGGTGVVVLVSCETDFVAGNRDFRTFVDAVAATALAGRISEVTALGAAALPDGGTVRDGLHAMIQRIGENLKLETVHLLAGAQVVGYNHGGRVATLVAGSGDAHLLKNLAMHCAAANPAPLALDRATVDPARLEREREVLLQSAEVLAKPEQLRAKIVEGKLSRFYKDYVLLEQELLVDGDGKLSVGQYCTAHRLVVTGFVRCEV
jgi:elongation factor Ts